MGNLEHELELRNKSYKELQQQYTEQKVFYQKK